MTPTEAHIWASINTSAVVRVTIKQYRAKAKHAAADAMQSVVDERTAENAKRMEQPRHARDLKPRTYRMVSAWRPVIDEVVASHKVPEREVFSGHRGYKQTAARHEIWFRLHQRGVAHSEIGRRLGGYDPSSVLHGVRKFAAEREAA